MSSAEKVDVGPKKTTTKRVRQFDVVVSDRIQMVDAANELVWHMIQKQVLPALSAGVVHAEVPLSENEQKTLDAALCFLRRQFEAGYSVTEPYESHVESEETLEFQ